MPKLAFTVLVAQEPEGGYSALCLELEGCMTQAETEQELMENILDAIQVNVDWLRSEGRPVPSARLDLISEDAYSIPDEIPEALRERFAGLDEKMWHSAQQRRLVLT